jgi:oligopeptide transport system permease protein
MSWINSIDIESRFKLNDIDLEDPNESKLFKFIEFDPQRAEKTAATGYSYWKSTFKLFFSKKSSRIVLSFLCLLLLFIIIQPYLPNQKDPIQIFKEGNAAIRNAKPNSEFLFGTNAIGQDLWARIWSGTRTTLFIGIVSVTVNAVVGIIIGAIWGYVRKVDKIFTEIYNVLNNVPTTIVRMLIAYILRPSVSTLIFAMCLTGWLGMAKWIRNLIIIVRDREYNLASRCLGTPTKRVITKNLLPQLISVILLDSAISIPDIIGSEVFLSYIGLGLPASIPSLGNLINEGRRVMMVPTQTYQIIFPSIVVAVITISFYALGNAFSDASDPRNHV